MGMIGSMLSGLDRCRRRDPRRHGCPVQVSVDGVQDRLRDKLMRFAGRTTARRFPTGSGLLFDYPDAAPELGEI